MSIVMLNEVKHPNVTNIVIRWRYAKFPKLILMGVGKITIVRKNVFQAVETKK